MNKLLFGGVTSLKLSYKWTPSNIFVRNFKHRCNVILCSRFLKTAIFEEYHSVAKINGNGNVICIWEFSGKIIQCLAHTKVCLIVCLKIFIFSRTIFKAYIQSNLNNKIAIDNLYLGFLAFDKRIWKYCSL